MSELLYVGLIAVVVAAFVVMLWLKREGDAEWERVRPKRVRVVLELDFTEFEAAMKRMAAATADLGAAFRKIGDAS
jgi:hypothetical protein